MNHRTFLTALGTAMLTISAGCASDADEEDIMSELTDVTKLKENEFGGPNVTRFVDREAGVVLYESWDGAGEGVTAIPLSETDLE